MKGSVVQYKIRLMQIVFVVGLFLTIGKFTAYFLTGSNAILSDALESIINVFAGGIATYGVRFAAQPKDEDHPYGHGKIEFLSAGAEGGLIFLAGLYIIYKAILSFFETPEFENWGAGIILIAAAGLANFVMGYKLVKEGKKHHSALLVADGRHLLTDTVTSVGVLLGLALVYITGYKWLDSVTAIICALYILYTGYKLIQEATTTLLDRADYAKLKELVALFSSNRREKWIDIHNLRTQKYGNDLHVDCHITLPWYDTLDESHKEVDYLRDMVQENMVNDVEFFVHADPCVPPKSCAVCMLKDCPVRRAPFVKKVDWNLGNLLPNQKHTAD
jgi:cation diffusion facilitator family transporter